MDLRQELALAEQLVRQAGSLALNLRDHLAVREKPLGQGPVTNADTMIDELICDTLMREYPHDRIISEESYVDDGLPIGSGRTWFIDPIDGTKSYISGADDFVNMIGLAINGQAVLGVVYQPMRDRLWRGIFDPTHQNSFAEKIDHGHKTDLIIPSLKRAPTDIRLMVSRTHTSLRQQALIEELKPLEIIYKSSVGLKAMLILDHGANLYVAWSKQIKVWDTCAPDAIINATGATMTFLNQQRLSYVETITHNKTLMIANFIPDEDLLDLLKTIEKD